MQFRLNRADPEDTGARLQGHRRSLDLMTIDRTMLLDDPAQRSRPGAVNRALDVRDTATLVFSNLTRLNL